MDIARIELPDQPYLYVACECPYGPEISKTMGAGFAELFGFLGQNAISAVSNPMSIYHGMDPETLRFQAAVCVSADDAARAGGAVKAGSLAAGPALKAVHMGPYHALSQSHQALWTHAKERGLQTHMPTWEHYIDDPDEVDVAGLRTEIFLPLD